MSNSDNTDLVRVIFEVNSGSEANDFNIANNKLFFRASGGLFEQGLWVTDGVNMRINRKVNFANGYDLT